MAHYLHIVTGVSEHNYIQRRNRMAGFARLKNNAKVHKPGFRKALDIAGGQQVVHPAENIERIRSVRCRFALYGI